MIMFGNVWSEKFCTIFKFLYLSIHEISQEEEIINFAFSDLWLDSWWMALCVLCTMERHHFTHFTLSSALLWGAARILSIWWKEWKYLDWTETSRARLQFWSKFANRQDSCVGMSWVSFGIQIICRAAASDQRGRRSQPSEQPSRPRFTAGPVSTVLTDYIHSTLPMDLPRKIVFLTVSKDWLWITGRPMLLLLSWQWEKCCCCWWCFDIALGRQPLNQILICCIASGAAPPHTEAASNKYRSVQELRSTSTLFRYFWF